MKAVIYLRRSKESGERQVSIEVQRKSCQAYVAARPGVTVAEVLHDGVSGGDGRRSLDIIKAIEKHQADSLVVYHQDRLARDTEWLLKYLRFFKKNGVKVYSCDQGELRVDTAAGLLQTGIGAVIAEHHRVLVSEKTRDALAELKANGRRYSGVAPYGYSFDGPCLVENSDEQYILTMILGYFADGQGVRAIARELNRQGLRARNNNSWAPSTIFQIVRRKA